MQSRNARKDISDSTYSTSESIQTQTNMTHNIQESLQITIESSENMVRVAQHSNELNKQNLVLMGDLKQQSQVIAQTNGDVADEIRQLAEKTIENLGNAESAKNELSNVLNVSHQLDKYM